MKFQPHLYELASMEGTLLHLLSALFKKQTLMTFLVHFGDSFECVLLLLVPLIFQQPNESYHYGCQQGPCVSWSYRNF